MGYWTKMGWNTCWCNKHKYFTENIELQLLFMIKKDLPGKEWWYDDESANYVNYQGGEALRVLLETNKNLTSLNLDGKEENCLR